MKSFSPIAKPLEFSHIETELLLNLRDETFLGEQERTQQQWITMTTTTAMMTTKMSYKL